MKEIYKLFLLILLYCLGLPKVIILWKTKWSVDNIAESKQYFFLPRKIKKALLNSIDIWDNSRE